MQFPEYRARRVRHDFALADEYTGVVRICQLVEGMPLALELAATWTKTLRCERIAAEIEQNLDFLSTRLRNLPARHHSMKAVFERCWALLSEGEQAVFSRLCVFRGGFDDLAAAQCVGASLAQLAGLVELHHERRGDAAHARGWIGPHHPLLVALE